MLLINDNGGCPVNGHNSIEDLDVGVRPRRRIPSRWSRRCPRPESTGDSFCSMPSTLNTHVSQ